ncbi:MAG: hypothetical protein L0216_19420 [Planctomycetales bacterium]|nr:hypothetical protein [Planctomycetales bacterium]
MEPASARSLLSRFTPSVQSYFACRYEEEGDDGLTRALHLMDCLAELGCQHLQIPLPASPPSEPLGITGTRIGKGEFSTAIPPRILGLRGAEQRQVLEDWFDMVVPVE